MKLAYFFHLWSRLYFCRKIETTETRRNCWASHFNTPHPASAPAFLSGVAFPEMSGFFRVCTPQPRCALLAVYYEPCVYILLCLCLFSSFFFCGAWTLYLLLFLWLMSHVNLVYAHPLLFMCTWGTGCYIKLPLAAFCTVSPLPCTALYRVKEK